MKRYNPFLLYLVILYMDKEVNLINRDLEIMKHIESEMIKANNERGEMYYKDDFRVWQDKQLELGTIKKNICRHKK